MAKIIRSDRFTNLFNINGITLWPFIIINSTADDVTINHEKIHIAQQLEMWILPFYIQYLLDYRKGLKVYSDLTPTSFKQLKSYAQIRFEQEAYANETDFNYLKTRKRFSWKNYVI